MTATKKTTVKKPVYKAGQKIRVKKTGAVGKIIELAERKNGLWLFVNFGDKKKSVNRFVRPGAVEKA